MRDAASELFGEVVYAYTRADAMADGVLVDVGAATDEAGKKVLSMFKWPVAMSRAAYEATVCDGGTWVPDGNGDEELILPTGQSPTGRLWDVGCLLLNAIRTSEDGDMVEFSVLVDVNGDGKHKQVDLYSVCGPGDHGEPVVTIMLQGED